MAAVAKIAGSKPGCIHLHDTRSIGIPNVSAALDAGARVLDGSLSGLGGLPVRAGRDRKSCRESGVPVREQGICRRGRYREAGRGAFDPEIGNAERAIVWRAGARRIALWNGGAGCLILISNQAGGPVCAPLASCPGPSGSAPRAHNARRARR